MNQTTTGYVKVVANSDEPTDNFHLTLQFPSAVRMYMCFNVFQLTVYVVLLTALLFWSTLTALINHSDAAQSCFQ